MTHQNVRGLKLAALSLAALGVVYGDIGTSPLYTLATIFSDLGGVPNENVALGALSLVIWTITLMVLVNYVGIVIGINDNGEGGAFALYAIIRRAVDPKSSEFGVAQRETLPVTKFMDFINNSKWFRRCVLALVIMSFSLMTADGILTPAISVMSAVEGVQKFAGISHTSVLLITIGILAALFSVQRFGTTKVGITFGPIMLAWFLFNLGVGIYNVCSMPSVFKALSPHYIYYVVEHAGAWGTFKLLGSVFLAITGADAMYADIGHLNPASVRIAFCTIAYPSLVMTYIGQTAVALGDATTYSSLYWSSIPAPLKWPAVVIATLASVIASQALISGLFTVYHQAVHNNVFPRLTVVQTSKDHAGQIYIPAVNAAAFVGCVAVVLIFGESANMASAYGFSVSGVMMITYVLVSFVLVLMDKSILFSIVYGIVFGTATTLFFASTALKVPHGAWLTIVIGVVISVIATAWFRGYKAKTRFIKANKLTARQVFRSAPTSDRNIIFYNELIDSVVPSYGQLSKLATISGANNISLTVRKMPIPTVPEAERFLVSNHDGVYFVVARYGYSDVVDHGPPFARKLCREIGAEADDVTFVVGRTSLATSEGSSINKKITVAAYNTLTWLSSWTTDSFKTPRDSLIVFETVYTL
ncbi:potassium transporter [Acanthocystis turfacea Chlorella virus MN0810.1]|nr:potassium transporter [Acanthocystis turfacea Chlorella virus MN0810.1]